MSILNKLQLGPVARNTRQFPAARAASVPSDSTRNFASYLNGTPPIDQDLGNKQASEVVRSSDTSKIEQNRLDNSLTMSELKEDNRKTMSEGFQWAAKALDGLRHDGQRIQKLIHSAEHGKKMSARDILVWQSRVYTYSQRVDLATRVVDKSLSTLRSLTQIQV